MGNTEKDAVVAAFITVPDKDKAGSIGRAVVDERLCACVNVIPLQQSIFRWEGKVCEEQELLLVMKTVSALLPTLEKRVKELHPYEVPEFIALPCVHVSEGYHAWVKNSVSVP